MRAQKRERALKLRLRVEAAAAFDARRARAAWRAAAA